MRKIILSVAVAAMALSTTASALEDIKVNGQAKLWYETNDVGVGTDSNSLFENKAGGTSGEIVFKLGVTGKQGNVGFGATLYNTTDLGLTGEALTATRSDTTNSDMFLGEAYVTAPMGSMASLKLGRQELNTPFLFTETWNALPNTFDAAVVTVKPMNDLSLVAMYVGQDNADTNFKVDGAARTSIFGGALVVGALYKNSAFDANFWYTNVGNYNNPNTTLVTEDETLSAFYLDAGTKVANVNLRAYAATVDGSDSEKSTEAYALSAGTKVGTFDLFAAASTTTDDGHHSVANISTVNKKSFLPTEAVYTDGLYVAHPDSTAFKVKASTKLGSTGIALQVVDNSNDTTATKETTEFDLFLTDKFGDFSTTAILMHRSFDKDAEDDAQGGIYARFIVALNF
ncbi:MAG: hypothetical protein PHX44_07595 [Sulfurimonas sp.]|uniref:hypothetical protein n=1 Tax=Sulfurimonas sp. TaxID=2022749 RepID=UPI00260F26F7|nr:hypothetical protein [Sulfurimonas sp.]MDD2652898.1 hypothetical protein [Sulfurimonas sp.]MDD3452344.1 hypothetical protein [Sulfurimonas sp.]